MPDKLGRDFQYLLALGVLVCPYDNPAYASCQARKVTMNYAQELPKAVQSAPEEDFCGEVRREWYSVYPREFLKHELWLTLRPHRRSVFQALYLHADKNRRCWPSLKTIAEEAGVCESTARSSLRYLEDACFIKTESRYRQGQQTSNVYTL